MDFSGLGKVLMVGGVAIFAIGLLFVLGDKIPFLGRLPGDLFVQRKGFSFYFPVVTCVVLSIIGSIILSFFSRR